jgi:hypothetical protein
MRSADRVRPVCIRSYGGYLLSTKKEEREKREERERKGE